MFTSGFLVLCLFLGVTEGVDDSYSVLDAVNQALGPSLSGGNIELAHYKPASQSSELWGGKPNRAVDGDTSGQWAHSSCTHTAKQQNSWWKVELGAEYSIDRVTVWNRSDCCGNMLKQATVMVDDASCGSLGTARKQTVACSGKKGKVVKIQHSRDDYLMLCEVKVYGSLAAPPSPPHPPAADVSYTHFGTKQKAKYCGQSNGAGWHTRYHAGTTVANAAECQAKCVAAGSSCGGITLRAGSHCILCPKSTGFDDCGNSYQLCDAIYDSWAKGEPSSTRAP